MASLINSRNLNFSSSSCARTLFISSGRLDNVIRRCNCSMFLFRWSSSFSICCRLVVLGDGCMRTSGFFCDFLVLMAILLVAFDFWGISLTFVVVGFGCLTAEFWVNDFFGTNFDCGAVWVVCEAVCELRRSVTVFWTLSRFSRNGLMMISASGMRIVRSRYVALEFVLSIDSTFSRFTEWLLDCSNAAFSLWPFLIFDEVQLLQ